MKTQILFFLAVFLVSVLIVGCGSTSSSTENTSNTTAAAQNEEGFEKVSIKLAHATPDSDISHMHQASLKFKEIVEKKTGGQVTINIHPNSQLGGEREIIEGTQLGTIDMAFVSSGVLGNFAPEVNAFDFPFLFRDREHVERVFDGEIGADVGAKLEEVNLKVLAWAENGFRNITNSKHPIKTPEDMEGLKIRTQENRVHIDAFKALGADATPMAWPEVFTAMQQGVVDGQETPLSLIVPSNFFEVQNHLTISHHLYSAFPFVINKDKFDSLSPELQKVFVEAAEETRDWERQFMIELDEELLQTAINEGMKVVPREEFDYEAFVEASQPVYEQYEAEFGVLLKRIQAE
ncbi:TRAP transporter substrate-binding protein [Halalkalibacterium ligniniphilum]|uniref:TRAP transporter substrate-binding protein n=1 Tax=Halalkalibacterium ligniniphilum TaxID=1134413 RepID=UPI000347D45A|nr:TRAP transporter substrate-binding protein [Halalkalibacterium ligniniphilum]